MANEKTTETAGLAGGAPESQDKLGESMYTYRRWSERETSGPVGRPRGYYKAEEKWAKDQSSEYYAGFQNRVTWPLVKAVALLIIGVGVTALTASWLWALLACIFVTAAYQRVVALVLPNTIAMPSMDQQTFISTGKAHVNYMNCSTYDSLNPEAFFCKFEEMFKLMPKFQYKIKEIAGDYYYEKMTLEETREKAFLFPRTADKVLRNQQQVDEYIRDNMNIKLPLDGPLFRIYYQEYCPEEDDPTVPSDKKTKGVMIWKCHHSFCDGISVMCMTLALSEEYDRSYFVKGQDASWLQAIGVRLMMPFYIPQILKDTVLAKADDNMFTRNKSKMTGNISISSTKGIDLAAMKEFSKKMGISINDFVLCALTTTLNTIFKENNDPVEEFKIVIPANIRFKFYPTKEEVKLENKFAAIPLTVPTTDTMETSYDKIKSVTGQLRSSLGLIYAVYALSFWSTMLTPKAVVLSTIQTMSAKFTIGFSNTPGPIKPFVYKDHASGELIHNLKAQSYLMVAGQLGFILCAISQSGALRMTLQSDEAICDQQLNERILKMMHQNIMDEIERGKSLPMPEETKKSK